MTLRAAHAGQLVQVEDHSREQAAVDRLELVGHPAGGEAGTDVGGAGRAEAGRGRGRAQARRGGPRAPSCPRPAAGSHSPRSDHRPCAARAGRDDRTLSRERFDRDHRRALVSRGEERGVEGGIPGRGFAAGSRRSESARRRRARRASASISPRSSPSPTSTRTASTSSSTSALSVRTRSSGRLIAVSRPAQPIANVSSSRPSCARSRARASSSAALHSGSSKPYGTTAKRPRGATRTRRGRRAPPR